MAITPLANNVGQFGAIDGTVLRYKQAAEYAEDARKWALEAANASSGSAQLLALAQQALDQAIALMPQVDGLELRVAAAEVDIVNAVGLANSSISSAQAALANANTALNTVNAAVGASQQAQSDAESARDDARDYSNLAQQYSQSAAGFSGSSSGFAVDSQAARTDAQTAAALAATEADRAEQAVLDAQAAAANVLTVDKIDGFAKVYMTKAEADADVADRTAGEVVVVWNDTSASYGLYHVIDTAGVKSLVPTNDPVTGSHQIHRILTVNTVAPDAAGNVDLKIDAGNPALWLGETVFFQHNPASNLTVSYPGLLPQDGRQVSRTTYSELWDKIRTDVLPSVSLVDWNAGQKNCFNWGDGDKSTGTTFGLPQWDGQAIRAPQRTEGASTTFHAQIPYIVSINGVTAVNDAGELVLKLSDLGSSLGQPLLTQTLNFDWQNYDFTVGETVLTKYDTRAGNGGWIVANTPAGITYSDGTGVYLTSEGGVNNRHTVRVTPDTAANGNYTIYEVLMIGAKGFRTFTVREIVTSNKVISVANGGTGATTVNDARTALQAAKSGINDDIVQLTGLSGPLTLGGDGAGDDDAVTLRQLRTSSGGSGASLNGVITNFIGAVEWFSGTAANIPAGYVPANGQALSRTEYADLYAGVSNNFFVNVAEALWLDSGDTTLPGNNRGKYSQGGTTNPPTGSGVTGAWFRVPDLNGIQNLSAAALFLRGSGDAGAQGAGGLGSVGTVHLSSAPNITGNFNIAPDGANVALANNQSGAFRSSGAQIAVAQIPSGTGAANRTVSTSFDASRPKVAGIGGDSAYGRDNTGEIRPNSVTGTWIIRAKGTFEAQNTNFQVITDRQGAPAAGFDVQGGTVQSIAKIDGTGIAHANLIASRVQGNNYTKALVTAYDQATAESGTLEIHSNGNARVKGNLIIDKSLSYAQSSSPDTPLGMLTYDSNLNRVNLGNNLFSEVQINSSGSVFLANQLVNQTNTWGLLKSEAGSFLQSDNTRRNNILRCEHGSSGSSEIFGYTNPGVLSSLYINVDTASFEFRSNGTGYSPQGWSPASDQRLKTNIAVIEEPLEKMKQLHGCTWNRKDFKDAKGIGFIAQDVQKVFPEFVHVVADVTLESDEVIKDVLSPDTYGIAAGLHHEAILALMAKVEALEAEVKSLKGVK